MPQDVRELGRRVKAKYPGKYDDLADEDVGRRVKRKYPGAYDDFTDAPAAQPPGFIENALIGPARGAIKYIADPLLAIAEGYVSPQSSAQSGEQAARGAKQLVSQYIDPTGQLAAEQAPAIQAGQRRLAESRANAPGFKQTKAALDYLNARAALDPSITGKITRGTGEVVVGALPAVAMGAYGGAPMAAGVAALQSAAQPETTAFNVGASVALPAITSQIVGPAFRSGINTVRRAFGKGAAQIIEAEALPAARAQVREAIGEPPPLSAEISPPAPPTAPANPLQTAFQKLGTDDTEQIGAIIANANRRFKKSATPAERQSSMEDYNRLNQLRPDEQRALSHVLPPRNYEPVGEFEKGGYSRNISDIPAGQPNAQLDANLRELEAFFTQEGRTAGLLAPAPMEIAPSGATSNIDFVGAFRGAGKGISDNLKNAIRDSVARTGKLPRAERGSSIGRAYEAAVANGAPRSVATLDVILEAELGVSAASPSARAASASVSGPSVGADLDALNIAAPKAAEAAAKTPWQDTVLAYLRANWLTNPVGRANDLGNTIINQFADAVVRPVAAAADVIVSKLTGARSITGPSLRGTGRALGSIKQGLRDAGKVLKTGEQAIESGADDVLYGAEIRSGLGKVVDVPINGVFRLLGAMDAPFRRFGFVRNLYDRAKVAAINERKAGKISWDEVAERANQLTESDEIIKAAIRDGESAVLSDPNRFSGWIAKQMANSPNARLAVGLIQPFLRIPANATMKAADFAGLGGVKALYKIARGLRRKVKGETFFRDLEEQRVFDQNVAAGSFGVAGFMLGMRLEERGNMEGFFYTSKKDFPNGKVPTSVNINGQNYDINRLGGFIFAPLFVGATYNRLRKQDVGKANALLRSFSGLAQQAPVIGYYGAIPTAARIAAEPGKEAPKQAGNIASGFIPASGLVRATAKAFDLIPQKGPRSAFVDGAMEKSRPLFTELQRLNKRVSELRKKDGEKDDVFNARVQQFSANYTRFGQQLIDNPRFKAAPDAVKALALDALNNRAKGITNREFAFPEIELDANLLMDAAEESKKNPANK